MSAFPAWTPASRPGIVPLYPLSFGMILGRSFTALRHNPKVLLGFALGVQAIAYVVLILAIGGIAFASFSRLDTVTPGSDEFDAILAGSIALTVITTLLLSLVVGAFSVVVQAVVVTDVAFAVLAEKPTLRTVWRRIRPVAWRLLGYAFLLGLAVLVVLGAVVGALVALGFVLLPVAILLGVLAALGLVVVYWWLATKLAVVPAVIILERATIRRAIARSWRLTRTRFWSTFGILILLSIIFGTVAQIISVPLSLVSSAFTTILTPTGDPQVGALVGAIVTGLITQVLVLLVQCVALIVQSTAVGLVYVDCRMRHEGLDLDLQTYVERRDAGATDLPDPFLQHVGRTVAPRPTPGYAPPAQPGSATPYPAAPAYPGAYPPPPSTAAPQGYAPAPAAAYPPAPPAPPAPDAAPPAPPAPPVADAAPPAAPADRTDDATRWAAPGGAPDGTDRSA